MQRKLLGAAAAATVAVAALVAPAAAATNDPYFGKQWGLDKIKAEQAWATSDGSGTIIAVVDTGVDLGHPDLSSKIIDNADADFVEPKGVQDGAQDENGHGTHVAGIAGAITGNGVGVAGTAPGAQILPVRVLDDEGAGTTSAIADGIRYAADRGVDVINLSLSYDVRGHVSKVEGTLAPVYSAIEYAAGKGVVVVAAAGNGALRETSAPAAPICSEPAANPRVICVGAADRNDRPAYYTNWDATQTRNFLVAPGGAGLTCDGEIISTYLRGAETFCSNDPGYEALSGSSMATPFVSGVAALLASKGLEPEAIVRCILDSADDVGIPGRDRVFGYGRLNAAAAVTGC